MDLLSEDLTRRDNPTQRGVNESVFSRHHILLIDRQEVYFYLLCDVAGQ